jgi:hypothetical protein
VNAGKEDKGQPSHKKLRTEGQSTSKAKLVLGGICFHQKKGLYSMNSSSNSLRIHIEEVKMCI